LVAKERTNFFKKVIMEHDVRPWGEYFVLEDFSTHKVKRIVVKPKGRLSYQYHQKRSEVWTIVSGVSRITLDGERKDYNPGDVVKISQGVKHRIENPSSEKDCVFIEVQLGSYFGEDDIVRIEDDYNRS
jgi:mannose-6-phosphate isomerase